MCCDSLATQGVYHENPAGPRFCTAAGPGLISGFISVTVAVRRRQILPLRRARQPTEHTGMQKRSDFSQERTAAIRRAIRSIPRGKVATYGQVAAAAGCPAGARRVAFLLHREGDALPWQRVLGAGGRIRLQGASGREQRLRLEMEGILFRGRRVDLPRFQHIFPHRKGETS